MQIDSASTLNILSLAKSVLMVKGTGKTEKSRVHFKIRKLCFISNKLGRKGTLI